MGGNFKVRALKSYSTDSDFFELGDIIEFKNGRCVWNDGTSSFQYENFEDLIYSNGWEKELELIEEEGENEMEDLRNLIKPCYVVVRRDGSVCGIFAIKDDLRLQECLNMTNCSLEDYREDLKKYKEEDDTDIVKIYGLSEDSSFDISTDNRPLIWKREEPIEKSPTKLEIESIESEMKSLTDRLAKLKEKM